MKEKHKSTKFASRRDFLKLSATLGTTAMIGGSLASCQSKEEPAEAPVSEAPPMAKDCGNPRLEIVIFRVSFSCLLKRSDRAIDRYPGR